MEQVEFSNIVILNKTDLVNKEQQQDILERINILNPKVKVLKSCQSKIDVTEILNTKLYNAADMGINSVMASASRVKAGLNNLHLNKIQNRCFSKISFLKLLFFIKTPIFHTLLQNIYPWIEGLGGGEFATAFFTAHLMFPLINSFMASSVYIIICMTVRPQCFAHNRITHETHDSITESKLFWGRK